MDTATDLTSVQLRHSSNSPLNTTEQSANDSLEDYTPPQESDMSADFCGSDMHSPSSVVSSASSSKFMSQLDRQHSDQSDDCYSPTNEKQRSSSDIEMLPNDLDRPTSNGDKHVYDEYENTNKDYETYPRRRPSESNEQSIDERQMYQTNLKRTKTLEEDTVDKTPEQKHMADIVGEASSPGEFFEHAFEFFKNGQQVGLRQSELASKEFSNSKSDFSNNKKLGKRSRSNETDFDEKYFYGSEMRNRIKERGLRLQTGNEKNAKQDHRSSSSDLTPDEKLFMDAFKREVASAAEYAAESSALRVLKLLEASGISFRRAAYGLEQYERQSTPRSSPNATKQTENKNADPHRSNQILDHTKDGNLYSGLYGAEDMESRIRTSSQSQLCFGSVQVNSVGSSKSAVENEVVDVVHDRSGLDYSKTSITKQSGNLNSSSDECTEAVEEQTHALSLVTKKPSGIDNDSTCKKTSMDHTTSFPSSVHDTTLAMTPIPPTFAPFVRRPFVTSVPTMPVSSALSATTSIGYPTNIESKFIPATIESYSGPSNKRSRISITDGIQYPLEAGLSMRSKEKTRTRTSPVSAENRRLSPEFDMKRQKYKPPPMGFETSAFRKHDVTRFPPASKEYAPPHHGIRSLRSGGSTDRKPFQPPLGLMYPFSGLPLFPNFTQSSQFAAALASISHARRNGIPEFPDVANGSTGLLDNRMALHHSLRNHHVRDGNFMTTHSSMPIREGYDVEASSYAFPGNMQEGLTPQHLKKAKLIFFYTRYPNANILKAYFPDVKFTRAITSQLIKWFSNFREFFYIQMEKFARQAVTEGVVDPSSLRVSRDSEVFRVLNLHYNKCNEFYVPEKFLGVTEASQREFFLAVRARKDSDPAWKKVIYKVICKLDAEIPEIFKSPNVLDRLHEIRE